jgi:hypothetical protein
MNIIFFNHKIENCGVYQYGKRAFEILKNNNEINYIYKEIDCFDEYTRVLTENVNIKAIIYNYHSCTMQWLNLSNIQTNVKNIGIPHESPDNLFDIVCNVDPDAKETHKNFSLPRPIYENIEDLLNSPLENKIVNNFINEYTDTNMPIFGSFGFGFDRKGFDKIVKIVNDNFDSAIIKFIMPHADTIASDHNVVTRCLKNITKPGIKIMINHEFLDEKDILLFLRTNNVNVFMYDTHNSAGLSSVIDYALSVKRPITISDASWFRHIYSDEICVYKNNIRNILNATNNYCLKFNNIFSNENLRNKVKNIFNNII